MRPVPLPAQPKQSFLGQAAALSLTAKNVLVAVSVRKNVLCRLFILTNRPAGL